MTKLKWGLIGSGDIARKRVAPALSDLPNCDFAAVSRARSELAAEFAAEFGAKKWYRTLQELISDPEIDAVYIATPVDLHAAQTIAAAEAGKHVLCEKPMALNVADCDAMIKACRENGVKLGVAYYRRFYPIVERVKTLLASNAIGKSVIAQINAFEQFNPANDNPRAWLIKKEISGGGPMFDFGCHRLELLMNIFGAIEIVQSVAAKVAFETREVEDTALALLKFESNLCAVLSVTHAAREAQDTLDIFGTEGSLHIPILNQAELRIVSGNEQTIEQHSPAPNVHQPLINDFTEAVLNNREPQVSGETGKNVAILEAEVYRRAGF